MLKWAVHGHTKDTNDGHFSKNLTDNASNVVNKNNDLNRNKHCQLVPIEPFSEEKENQQCLQCNDDVKKVKTDSNPSCDIIKNVKEVSHTECTTVKCSIASCFLTSNISPPSPKTLNKKNSSSDKTQISNHPSFTRKLKKLSHLQSIEDITEDIKKNSPLHECNFDPKMASALPDVAEPAILSREILGPDVAWDEQDVSLAQLVEQDRLPCVGCYEEQIREKDGQWEKLAPGIKIFSRQPVLFHSSVRQRQARARTIFKDPSGRYCEVGQTMIIPGDYEGWFELVPSDFSRASCYMSIAEVATNMPKKFFTRSNIKAIRAEGEGSEQKFLERKITAGSVLETKGTFSAKWKVVAETGVLKKKKKEWEYQEVTYLKCMDADQSEVLVPLNHKGKFNAIYEKGHLTQQAVYSIKDILSDLSLPVKVRLLFGKAPVVPCIFTGMLIIRSAPLMDTVVGSTILNTRNVLFEVPVSSPVKVKYISNDQPFSEMATYKDAQKLCKKYAKIYSSMIKLAPEMDTGQKVILHVPTDPSLMRQIDESLKALDLITDITLTGELKDHLLDSDTGSMESGDQVIIPPAGSLTELTEFKGRESQTFV